MNNSLKKKIADLIVEIDLASEKPNPYPFLPPIRQTLVEMLAAGPMSFSRRNGVAGGLGRLITEDFAFSESELGTRLIQVGDEFVTEYD